ncbi:hypothetical protein I2494_18510 [Budviciaceae bacterium BWR-B9]|uniref:DUF541 domain-containing protein n=1 Tax=Limnobaculum allomyrinae TaxID=2791986 RepID=A0ABS1IV87_9GAMM|nr:MULTISPECIES: hypothetical protein [Limnobaculum]MBK5145670.1 hypothetical protein [Limnobaculum allomyrinae]MBV7692615.1 hypothetical protein [Limnobaculum sp. M2-1]
MINIKFNLQKTAVGGLLFLFSHQAFCSVADLRVKSIEVPAYNLISDTLVGMSTPGSGKRNDFVLQLICDLARGDKNQQQANEVLQNNHIDVQSIPAKGSMSSLLINGDKADQASTCAAYVATSLFRENDNSALFDKSKAESGKIELTLNQQRFAKEMKVRMALAQATANLYAVVAANLPNNSELSFSDYQQSVASSVYNYAPEYLKLIQKLYSNDKAIYTPVAVTASSTSISDNESRELEITPQSIKFKSKGVVWLGEGKILGKEYFIPVKIIDSPVANKPKASRKANK